MSNPIVIKQPNKWMVKVILVLIMFSVPSSFCKKDVSIVNRICIVILSILLVITYLFSKARLKYLTIIYLLAIFFLFVFSLKSQQAREYAYLFTLSLPPLFNGKGIEDEATIQNQFRLFNGVSEAINALFSKSDQNVAIDEALALIGHASNVDYISIIENTIAENQNKYHLIERFRWGKESKTSISRSDGMQYSGRSHWGGFLSSGMTIQSTPSLLPESERYLIETKWIQSMLVVPIFIAEHFWGYIRFDDCKKKRNWSIDEEKVLQAAASAIGGAVKRLEWTIQEQSLKERTARLEALISHMDYGIVVEDKHNQLFLINDKFYQILGIPPLHEKELGMTHGEFFYKGKDIFTQGESFNKRIKEIFASRKKVIGEEWELRDGRIISRDAIPIFTNGEFDGYLWQFKETTEQKMHEQKLKEASIIDGLTKIYNRRYFDEMLEKEWGRCMRGAEPLTLIMLDIDGFKIYNDTYGHQKGDQCLIKVAQTVKSILKRPSDVFCRYGGEEFVVILPETHQKGGIKVAEKIRKAILGLKIEHCLSDVNDYVTCSLGVSTVIPTTVTSPEEIIRMADQALYTSKTLGRNCVSFYRLQKQIINN